MTKDYVLHVLKLKIIVSLIQLHAQNLKLTITHFKQFEKIISNF